MRKISLKAGLVMLVVGAVLFVSQDLNAAIEGEGVWLFDDGAGQVVSDSSVNNNGGYLGDTPDGVSRDATRDSSGKFGKCLSFNNPNGGSADQFVTVPDSPGLRITGDAISLEAWVNPGVDIGQSVGPLEYMAIMGKGTFDEKLLHPIAYTISFARDQGGVISADVMTGGVFNGVKTAITWKAGEWHHVAMSYDGEEIRLYIDGVLKDSVMASGNIADSSEKSLFIGASFNGHWGWTGKIDEVRVLNRALTVSEIEHDAKNSLRVLEGKKAADSSIKRKDKLMYKSATQKVKPNHNPVLGNSKPFPEICSFETMEDINKWKVGEGVTLKQSTKYATDGKHSARVTFLPKKKDYFLTLNFMDGKGFASRDWSDYAMLTFDIYGHNQGGVNLMLTIHDSKHMNLVKDAWHGWHEPLLFWTPFGIPGLKDTPEPRPKYIGWKGPWEEFPTNTITVPLLEPARFMSSRESWKAKVRDVEDIRIELFTTDRDEWLRRAVNWQARTDKVITFYLDNIRLLTREEAEPMLWTWVEMIGSGTAKALGEAPTSVSPEAVAEAVHVLRKEKGDIILNKIDIPEIAGIGEVLEGKAYITNSSNSFKEISVKITLLSSAKVNLMEKELMSSLGPEETKELGFSFSLPAFLSAGDYIIEANLSEQEKDVSDTLSCKLALKKSGLAVEIPFLPFFETVSVQTRFSNLTPKRELAILESSLEKDGKTIKTFPPKEVIGEPKKESVERHTFDVKDIQPGRYTLSASLLKENKVVSEVKKLARIYGPYTPVEERDFNYVLQQGRLYAGYPDYYRDADVFRTGYGPVIIIYPWIIPLEKYVEYQVPFVICEGLFSSWGMQDAPYELARERARAIIKEAQEIGGELFVGVWQGECDGFICRSMAVAEQETRLGKANAYIKVIKQFKEDFLGLPPDKTFWTGNYYVSNQALEAEAGVNVIVKESGGPPATLTPQMPLTRGVARSFRLPYGDVIASDGIHGETQHFRGITLHYDIKTGRYVPNSTVKVEPPIRWTWSLEDVYKMFIHRYYNGVNYLMGGNEHPQNSGEMVFNLLDFITENPRCKEIVSSVAILESKGNYIGTLQPRSAQNAAARNNSHEVFGLWEWLYPDNIPYKEEMDFLYLNSFFPNLTDDNVLYKHWWTGTPYGAIDRIYPAMKLDDMRKYNAIVFMGFHRMDSVRDDFLKDLMKYVKDGGITVLSADQMKDSNEEFNSGELKSFMGVSIAPAPKLKIKDYVKVVETTPFNIKKGRYPIASEVKFKGEKEPWVYKVISQGAKVIATDSQDIPVLLLNNYGKGYVFLFASPTLSMIPPVGKSPFICDVIDKVSRFKPLPVMLSPENEDVEFLIARTEDKEAIIFIMNHGEKVWEGDIIINLARCGLSSKVGEDVKAKLCQGYKVQEISPEVVQEDDRLIIRGIRVEGDTSEPAEYNYLPWLKPYEGQLELKTFCSYRQASFALIRLGGH